MAPNAPYAAQLAHLGQETRTVPAAMIALKVAVAITIWSQRIRTRRALSELDAHLLRDVGLTRHEARRESARRFWEG